MVGVRLRLCRADDIRFLRAVLLYRACGIRVRRTWLPYRTADILIGIGGRHRWLQHVASRRGLGNTDHRDQRRGGKNTAR